MVTDTTSGFVKFVPTAAVWPDPETAAMVADEGVSVIANGEVWPLKPNVTVTGVLVVTAFVLMLIFVRFTPCAIGKD